MLLEMLFSHDFLLHVPIYLCSMYVVYSHVGLKKEGHTNDQQTNKKNQVLLSWISSYLCFIIQTNVNWVLFGFQKMDPSGVKVLETAEDIQERRQQVLDRYHRFKELSSLRRQKLEDSYRFQFFQRDADELEKWIQEKLQIASDENYKDPSNLQARPTAVLQRCTVNIRMYHVNWSRQSKCISVAWSESSEQKLGANTYSLAKCSPRALCLCWHDWNISNSRWYAKSIQKKLVWCSVKPAWVNPRICWALELSVNKHYEKISEENGLVWEMDFQMLELSDVWEQTQQWHT